MLSITGQVVIDNSVYCKLFLDEAGRDKAVKFISYLNDKDIEILMPSLFMAEFLSVIRYKNIDFDTAYNFVSKQLELNMHIVADNKATARKALEISHTGNKNSGFLSIYDTQYHALAIVNDCWFVTADSKYYSKTKQLGNIKLLEDLVVN